MDTPHRGDNDDDDDDNSNNNNLLISVHTSLLGNTITLTPKRRGGSPFSFNYIYFLQLFCLVTKFSFDFF
jgi:hypothetical protein